MRQSRAAQQRPQSRSTSPALEAIVAGSRAARRLSFTTDIAQPASTHGEVLFIAVGTRLTRPGRPTSDMCSLWRARSASNLTGFKVVADKSDRPRSVPAISLPPPLPPSW